jgi:phospholipase C
MPQISRRSFIAGSATTAAAMAATGAAEAVALPGAAAAAATATIADVQHIVIFMQENRSFDHYFGALQGVRGFADRTAITLPGGNSVFCQPAGSGSQYPWQLSQDSFLGEDRGQCNGSLDHSWPTQHQAFNGGAMDGWVAAKGSDRTVGYLSRSDIGYHYDLADAYTICDAYHCSVLSATGPNRTYLFSGWIDPNEAAGGPAYDNGSEAGLTWQTYAETLQEAGLSWKVYQSYDNYGDNALEFFRQFQDLAPDAPLYPGVEQVPGSSSGSGDIARLIAGGSPPTWRPARSRRSPGSSPTRLTPSTRTRRLTTARTPSTWS